MNESLSQIAKKNVDDGDETAKKVNDGLSQIVHSPAAMR